MVDKPKKKSPTNRRKSGGQIKEKETDKQKKKWQDK